MVNLVLSLECADTLGFTSTSSRGQAKLANSRLTSHGAFTSGGGQFIADVDGRLPLLAPPCGFRQGTHQRLPVAASKASACSSSSSRWCRAWSAPCVRDFGFQGRVFRADTHDHDHRADVLGGDVDGVIVQAESFDRGGLGEGLCHDVDITPRSSVTHQRPRLAGRVADNEALGVLLDDPRRREAARRE
jgi:hypothetical protein